MWVLGEPQAKFQGKVTRARCMIDTKMAKKAQMIEKREKMTKRTKVKMESMMTLQKGKSPKRERKEELGRMDQRRNQRTTQRTTVN